MLVLFVVLMAYMGIANVWDLVVITDKSQPYLVCPGATHNVLTQCIPSPTSMCCREYSMLATCNKSACACKTSTDQFFPKCYSKVAPSKGFVAFKVTTAVTCVIVSVICGIAAIVMLAITREFTWLNDREFDPSVAQRELPAYPLPSPQDASPMVSPQQ